MKQIGNSIVGDPIRVDSYTSGWLSIRLHPSVFYRRLEQIREGLQKTKNLYATIDMGEYVYIRFAEKEDLTNFHRMHHEYV